MFSKLCFFHYIFSHKPCFSSPTHRFYLWLSLLLILLSGFYNFLLRDAQLGHWQQNSDIYYIGASPGVSTTDAAYFLSLAADYKSGATSQSFQESRLYPDNTAAYRSRHGLSSDSPSLPLSAVDIPLLSVVLSWLADLFYGGGLLTAGNMMLPITAALTAFAVGFLFWSAGYPMEGAIAATGFGLSHSYLLRTSIGRIDTDQLVIFFLSLVLSAILFASRQLEWRRFLLSIFIFCLFLMLFLWWYLKSPFVLLLPLLLGLGIYLHQRHLPRALLAFGLSVLVIGPLFYLSHIAPFIRRFLREFNLTSPPIPPNTTSTGLSFPDAAATITELSQLDFLGTLSAATAGSYIGILGFVGFIVFLAARPSKALVFLPFVILGLLSVFVGQRFVIYAAPFLWFGFAWLLLSFIRYFFKRGVIPASGAVFIFVGVFSYNDYIPRPSFDSRTLAVFSSLGASPDAASGILATWWDYGYIAHYISGMATLHDGGTQRGARTALFARGLLSPNSADLTQVTKFIATEGSLGIASHTGNAADLRRAISDADMPPRSIYLVLTAQMASWLGSISRLGLHDFTTAAPPSSDLLRRFLYRPLSCLRGSLPHRFNCREGVLDIQSGRLNGAAILSSVIRTKDGHIIDQRLFSGGGQYHLLIDDISGSGFLRLVLASDDLWSSNFNRLYHLGIYDSTQLELVLDSYPWGRVYRILH